MHLGHAVKHRIFEFAFQAIEFAPDLLVHLSLGLGVHAFDFIVKVHLGLTFIEIHSQVFAIGEHLPHPQHLAIILLLGYVAYGLSIYFYTYAQRAIGAAKTSTYYALAPFIGALLSIIMLGEPITLIFVIASAIMAAGCWVAAK